MHHTLPLFGGDQVTTKAIVTRVSEISKISVVDVDHAADEIVDGVLKREILFFDNRTPLIKTPLNYQRISNDDAEALIFNLLDTKSQITVPSRQIKEAIARLCYAPKLQIDLTEEFWRGQFYVNLAHGIYDIMHQKLVPMRNKLVFDYFINIRYLPHRKLEDAPVFKKYVESSIGMEQFECLMRVLGYSISSLTKGRKAFAFYGIGRTGKSTILNVLEAVIGGGLVSHEPFHTMSGERAKAHYEGKRVNISRETSTKVNRNEESFKSLISCEYTTGSEKFEK